MKYRYIYKIICTAGTFKNKFYFGQHTTDNLDDGYKGSGRKLGYYYKKHPNDYIKEIIAFYDTQEELNQAEYDIIHPYLNTPDCLNLMEGGGSVGSPSIETRKKLSEQKIGKPRPTPIWNKGLKGYNAGHKASAELKHHLSELARLRTGEKSPRYGKHHSNETKKILSEKTKLQFANCTYIWVSNGINSTRIDINKIDYYLSLGYHRGRK